MAIVALQARGQTVPNGGLEMGDFSHWTVSIPTGISEFNEFGIPSPTVKPAGTAEVVASWTGFSFSGDPIEILPHGGNYFAALGSAGSANFGPPPLTYDITATQTVSLAAGDLVSGWAAFFNGDGEAQDTASIKIFDVSGVELATPWSEVSGGGHQYSATPWTHWEWQAADTGDYTITLGMRTLGNDTFASFGFFDDIAIVPEPASVVLLGAGLSGWILVRRRRLQA